MRSMPLQVEIIRNKAEAKLLNVTMPNVTATRTSQVERNGANAKQAEEGGNHRSKAEAKTVNVAMPSVTTTGTKPGRKKRGKCKAGRCGRKSPKQSRSKDSERRHAKV